MICMIIYRKWKKHEPIVQEDLAEHHTYATKTA